MISYFPGRQDQEGPAKQSNQYAQRHDDMNQLGQLSERQTTQYEGKKREIGRSRARRTFHFILRTLD